MAYQIHMLSGRKELHAFRYCRHLATSTRKVEVQTDHITHRGKQLRNFKKVRKGFRRASQFVSSYGVGTPSLYCYGPFQRPDKFAVLWCPRDLAFQKILTCTYGTANFESIEESHAVGNTEINCMVQNWDDLGMQSRGCPTDRKENCLRDVGRYKKPLNDLISVEMTKLDDQSKFQYSVRL